MKTTTRTSKNPAIITMSEKTNGKTPCITANLKGKKLFADQIELAKKSLSNLKSLPI